MNRYHTSIPWDLAPDSTPKESPPGGPDAWQKPAMAAWEHETSELPRGEGAGISEGMFSDDGEPAAARVYLLPVHYEPTYRYPLVVWLHSDGYNEHQVEQVMPHISLQNYIGVGVRGVRAADSVGHQYDWAFSGAGVDAAQRAIAETVQEAGARFSVHPDRVILAGYRSGGTMALQVALREPEAYAGVVSLGGGLPRGGGSLGNLPSLRRRRMPMLWQWARLGEHFDHQRISDDLRTAMLVQAQVEVRQYEDDDEMNTVTLSDVNDWVMRWIVAGTGAGEIGRFASAEIPFSNN